jgi:ribosomal protein S27AE
MGVSGTPIETISPSPEPQALSHKPLESTCDPQPGNRQTDRPLHLYAAFPPHGAWHPVVKLPQSVCLSVHPSMGADCELLGSIQQTISRGIGNQLSAHSHRFVCTGGSIEPTHNDCQQCSMPSAATVMARHADNLQCAQAYSNQFHGGGIASTTAVPAMPTCTNALPSAPTGLNASPGPTFVRVFTTLGVVLSVKAVQMPHGVGV